MPSFRLSAQATSGNLTDAYAAGVIRPTARWGSPTKKIVLGFFFPFLSAICFSTSVTPAAPYAVSIKV